MKILMVCLGNICRSPLAEGILRQKVTDMDVTVDSAGTSAFHADEAPDIRSIQVARKNGLNISDLRGRQFTPQDFEDFDIIYVMDQSNYSKVMVMANTDEHKAKVKMLLNETSPGQDNSVPDPYYGGDTGFDDVFEMLDKATDVIVEKINNGRL